MCNSTNDAEDLGLTDRVVLVTGAGRGLGRTYATALARLGAHVVVHDAGVDQKGRDPDPSCATRVVDAIGAAGGSALAVTEVLRDAASCRRVVATALDRFGRLDGLIHNAGLVIRRDPGEVEQADYEASTNIGNDAAFWLVSVALPAMRERGFGRIVLTTSGWALAPYVGSDKLILYCHGKGAQFGLAMALAKGAGHPEILTNAICPIANTRIYTGDVEPGRLRPEAVAGAVTWLASPACRFTGLVVKAHDGTLALSRLVDVATRDLGDAADDPVVAGAMLTKMAEEAA